MEKPEFEILTADREFVDELARWGRDNDQDVQAGAVSEFGGGIESWLATGALLVPSIVALLKALYPFFDRGRVKAIRVGNLEIQNPRGKDVDSIISQLSELAESAGDQAISRSSDDVDIPGH